MLNNFKEIDLRQDKGALYENFIFSELVKKGLALKYWRTKAKAEVDFIVEDRVPVEVKSMLSKPVTGRSLFSFIEKYQPEKAYVFNRNLLKSINVNKTLVHFMYHVYAAGLKM